VFWGGYFTSVGTTSEYRHLKENQIPVDNDIRVVPIACQTRRVDGAMADGSQMRSPSGKYDGGPGGVILDSDLTETGHYQIRLSERQYKIRGKFLL
jgi:hypothetical protein